MRKNILIIMVVLLITILSVFIIRNLQNNKKEQNIEVMKIFKEEAMTVFLDNDMQNFDYIAEELNNIEHIKNVEFYSKEEGIEKFKEEFKEKSNLVDGYYEDVIKNSFYSKVEINSIDDINYKYFENIKNNIMNIKGIEKISHSFNTMISVYEKKGVKGLKEYRENIL